MSDHSALVRGTPLVRSSGFDPGRTRPSAFWGMAMAITTEAMLFAGLLSSYFFLRAGADEWPLGGIREPELRLVVPFTVILLSSSIPVWYAERAIGRGDLAGLRFGLAAGFVLGAAFVGYTAYELSTAEFGVGTNAYASVFLVTIGLHALHVVVGLAGSIGVQAKAWTGRIDRDRHRTVGLWAMYWHFVDVVWVFVFTTLYLSPRWG